ncbi:MAG: glycosyltransferase [Chloroflexota bacterium]|nr:glycosyltransferase [Chloroflexota bacterium]
MDRPLRIAMVSEHASPVALLGSEDAGGQNVYVSEVSRHLARLGHTVDVFTRRDALDAPETSDWVPSVRVVNLTAGEPQFLLKDKLWPLMPEFRDSFLRFMVRDGARYDVIHGNFWMSGWVVAELRRRLRIPAVHIFHAMGKTKRRHQGKADTSPDDRICAELEIIREVDRLIAQCPAERDELVGDYGAAPGKVALIPSAVDVKRFRPVARHEARARIGLDPDELVVVYVGRMVPRKGIRNLVRAVALLVRQEEIPPVRLLLVGGETREPDPVATPEIGVLQGLAAELGITEQVHFAGRKQPDELRYYYSAGDVAVTTPWYEPFGLTPLEAMACGTPVIGAAVGGIPFTVQAGVTGLLVPPRDPEALAARLRHLLLHEELRDRMGQAARRRVERLFTWSTVAQRTSELYYDLWAARTPARPELVLLRGNQQ